MRRALLGLAAVAVLAGGANAHPLRAPTPTRVAQAAPAPAPSLGNAADRALADVATAAQRAQQLVAQKKDLAARYQQQLAAVDDLKRQRASWRRDRQLQRALADSLETAKQLGAVTDQIAAAAAQLARARTVAVAAIDAELAAAPDGARKTALVAARATQAAALAPAQPKKIVLPDDTLDPLADPEELDQQAAALREGEAELAREAESLARQAESFAKQAELIRQHQRADDLAMRDDAEPRRTPGTGSAAGADRTNPSPQNGGGTPTDTLGAHDGFSGSSFEGQPDFVLADVIDSAAIDGLRRAGRGTDPGAKATAAAAAHDQVEARLRRLRERRAAIEARARELRKQ